MSQRAMSSESSIRRSGPWSNDRVREFLAEARIPMRLAANTDTGFPVVLSLWFLPEGDELLAAVHQDSRIAMRLKEDSRCAFEVAPNEPPYCGVRGQARASLESEGAGELLERLLDRYLGSTQSSLGRFLLGRAQEELVIRLQPLWIGSWDYSDRMNDAV
ncbi:MAG: pyridoxamine 5'-phosphate oxidase family protein [Myxococcales bacterium]|nr:pyridoxamine 5'-phosphate oxidase family protein [Myxococcales bacterium]